MNYQKIEALVGEACSEVSKDLDVTSLSDNELIAQGYLYQSIWNLRYAPLDIEDLVDWKGFIKRMRGIFSECVERAKSYAGDIARQSALVQGMYDFIYSPTMPSETVQTKMIRIASKFVKQVMGGKDFSWRIVQSAVKVCQSVYCSEDDGQDNPENNWVNGMIDSWKISDASDEPMEYLGKAMILQDKDVLDTNNFLSFMDGNMENLSTEELLSGSSVLLNVPQTDLKTELVERLENRMLEMSETYSPDRNILLASVANYANVMW